MTDWARIWQLARDAAMDVSAEPEDVAQDVCAAMVVRLSRGEPIVHLERYVRRAARKLACKRAGRPSEVLLEELPDLGAPGYQEELVDARRLAERARQAMARHKVGVAILYGAEATARDRKRLSRFRRDTREE